MGFQETYIDDKAPGLIHEDGFFLSLNYNNVYGRWITTQYLRQINENSKLNNSGFNKWLEFLAGKHLQQNSTRARTSTLNPAVAIWPLTGQGFQNTKWLAVLYSQ